MTSLAEKAILSGADNRSPMLEKDMYDSWKSRMELEWSDPVKEISELSPTKAIQADCDVKAINIILQGLPLEVYALVSTHKVAKELWERIQMLMQGTSLTKQERECKLCKLYDEFDKFAYKKGELLQVQNPNNVYNNVLYQNVQETSTFEQSSILNQSEAEITTLKETLSKFKGKAIVNVVVPLHSIDPELLKIDVAPLDPKLRNNRIAHTNYLRHTQEETTTLREIVESERLVNLLNTSLDYACKYTKCIQELLIILQQTCPCITELGNKLMAVAPKNNDKKIRLTKHIPSSGKTTVKTTPSTNLVSNTHVLSSTRVNLLSSASGSQPQGNTKNDRIQITTTAIVPLREPIPLASNTDKPVVTLIYSRKSKAAKKKVPVRYLKINESLVVQIVLWYLDSGCLKHMTEDRSQLINFVQKFLGTVKFRNDHVAKIMGYGDYKIGNVTILRVYFVEGLGHNLFSVGKFIDSDLEVTFRQHTCLIRNLDGVDLLTGSRGNNLYTLSLQDMMAS
nr:integrase, catalytic region, zinc finger, CCHC-type, peptidase aspartic, catalytic [Tanacetum cinerariifolium]